MVGEPIAFLRAGGRPAARTGCSGEQVRHWERQVRFDRRELDSIFAVYLRMVAAGEWRDYAIDFLPDQAIFSIHRRAREMPIYRIEKRPKLGWQRGQYAVIAATGHVLRRGHELGQVLRVFDRKLIGQLVVRHA